MKKTEKLRANMLSLKRDVSSLSNYIDGVVFRCDHIIEDMQCPVDTDEINEGKIEEYKKEIKTLARIVKDGVDNIIK